MTLTMMVFNWIPLWRGHEQQPTQLGGLRAMHQTSTLDADFVAGVTHQHLGEEESRLARLAGIRASNT
jgi:hypothetical protein